MGGVIVTPAKEGAVGRGGGTGTLSVLSVLLLLGAPASAGAQDPQVPQARPDSLRAVVLDRIRPPEPDTAAPPPLDPADPPADPAVDPAPPDPGVPPDLPSSTTATPRRAPPPDDADAFMRSLLDLEGTRSASYQGDHAEFFAQERRLELFGLEERRARFFGEGVSVEADSSIVYDDRDGRIRTTGITDFTPETGDPVRSRTIIYDLQQERGTAVEAQTTYTEGGRWIVSGNLDSVQEGLLFGSETRFTSCELDPPHSHFRAAQLKVVADRVLVARSVRMYVEDVPVLWLPFIAQNLGTGRASGILTPTFSINDVVRTSTGYSRRLSNVGYYWAMSDYSDLTVAMDWFSNNYTAVQGSLRYRWARRFLDGSANVKHYWQETGRRELAMDTRHSWQISERARFAASGRFVSSSDFVMRNSFDPREATQTVDSDANLNRRFDWANLTLGASRRQYLTEERTEMTLPSGSLSLSTLTLFTAPPQSARWYNNVSVTGSSRWDRQVSERELRPDATFTFHQASRVRTAGSARGSLGLGDLSLSGNFETTRSVFRDVPAEFFPLGSRPGGELEDETASWFAPGGGYGSQLVPMIPGSGDFRSGEMSWSAGISYRQRLIGATTVTPNVSLGGRMVQVDSIPQARSFVQGPTRVRLGVGLQTELYGFYRGFGQFEAIRHKLTPGIQWSYAPEITPTALQEAVFGGGVARKQSLLSFNVNQTWEARVSEDAMAARPVEAPPEEEAVPEIDPETGLALEQEPDVVPPARTALPAPEDGGPQRLPPSRVVTLLGLQTSGVTYDLIRADSIGRFLEGFTTTFVTNTVTSDYLRGLSLSFTHDLFDDAGRAEGAPRRVAPHLSQLSLGFALSHRTGAIQTLGRLLGLDPVAAAEPAEEPLPEDIVDDRPVGARTGFDPNRIIPSDDELDAPRVRPEGWDARIQYSLRRPRGSDLGSALRAQMIQGNLSFAPTANWTLDWTTSFDVETRSFNDHMVRLGRDLHEWEATFGFRQTATGNWSFQFEVSLRANRDLRVDYEQRSLQRDGF